MASRVQISVGVPPETVERAKALARTLSKRACGIRISMAEVLRLAVERGLAELETQETLSE